MLSDHLSELIETCISELEESKCIAVENEMDVSALNLGMIASYYYISHSTVDVFAASITAKIRIKGAMEILSAASEFSTLSFRQGEGDMLERMARHLPQALPPYSDYDDPAVKTLVLLQTHFSRGTMATDLTTDLKAVLKDSLKLLQALVDVISSHGWLKPALACMELSQMVVQGMWDRDPPMLQIPHFTPETVQRLSALKEPVTSVYGVLEMDDEDREQALQLSERQMSDVATFCNAYPNIDLSFQTRPVAAKSIRYSERSEALRIPFFKLLKIPPCIYDARPVAAHAGSRDIAGGGRSSVRGDAPTWPAQAGG